MNDFTKEELKELMFGLWCREKLDGRLVNETLYDKMKSMIDNYCEHESTGEVIGGRTGCSDCGKEW